MSYAYPSAQHKPGRNAGRTDHWAPAQQFPQQQAQRQYPPNGFQHRPQPQGHQAPPQQYPRQQPPLRQNVNQYMQPNPYLGTNYQQPQVQPQGHQYNGYRAEENFQPRQQYEMQNYTPNPQEDEAFHFEQIRSPVSQTFSIEDKPDLPPKIPMIPPSPSIETLSKINSNTASLNGPFSQSFTQPAYSGSDHDSVDNLIDKYAEAMTFSDNDNNTSDREGSSKPAVDLRKEKLRPASIVKELEQDSPPPYEELEPGSKMTVKDEKPRILPAVTPTLDSAEGPSSNNGSSNSVPYPIDDPVEGLSKSNEPAPRSRRYTDELLDELRSKNEQAKLRASSEHQLFNLPQSDDSAPYVDPITDFLAKRKLALADYKNFTLEIQFAWSKALIDATENKDIFTNITITGQKIKTLVNPSDIQKSRSTFVSAAIKVLKKISEKYDYAEANALLGDFYSGSKLPEFAEKDFQRGFEYYLRATKRKHPNATYKTGCCVEHGMGTKKDAEKCFHFYEKSALLGDPDGMCKLGIVYIKGLLNQPKSAQKSVYWLNKSIVSKDNAVLPIYILAKIYETDTITLGLNPHQVQQDARLIKELQNMEIYKDFKTALQLYLKAAKLGHTKSQTHLGHCYEFAGMGCAVNPRTSIYWYSKAAAKGDPNAEMGLSGWYLTGAEGLLKQSDLEAYLWARKASEKGLAKAEYALGYFNEVGVGTPKNPNEAKKWYKIAASQGYSKALKKLEAMR